MREQFPPVNLNLASVRIVGIPGLSLVLIVIAITFEFPQARWLFLSGLAGGALVAAALILVRRRRPIAPGGPGNGILMGGDPLSTRQDAWSSPPRSASGPASRPAPSSKSPKTSWAYASGAWPRDRSW